MIIESICNALFGIITDLVDMLNIPALPDGLRNVIMTLIDVLEYATPVIAFFIPYSIVSVFFVPLALAVVIVPAYQLVMWIIKKIPVLNID